MVDTRNDRLAHILIVVTTYNINDAYQFGRSILICITQAWQFYLACQFKTYFIILNLKEFIINSKYRNIDTKLNHLSEIVAI